MEFLSKLESLAGTLEQKSSHMLTEEATKTALIMPFLHNVLGYNIFDPSEVIPEFVADVGGKKDEKVDFAIVHNGQVRILIECKKHQEKLSLKHAGQLCRYFSTIQSAKIAILTNGTVYEFYTDLDVPNIMDDKPFLIFNISDTNNSLIAEIEKICKSSFNIESFLAVAEELKYLSLVKELLAKQMVDPDDDFLSFFISRVYGGTKTQKIKTQFYSVFKKASSQYLTDAITKRLKLAMSSETSKADEEQPIQEEASDAPRIETTGEELEAFYVIKSILRGTIDTSRITYRDRQRYCNILLDNNQNRRVCMLYFNGPQKSIAIYENDEKVKHPIDTIDDIYGLSEKLIEVVSNKLAELEPKE